MNLLTVFLRKTKTTRWHMAFVLPACLVLFVLLGCHKTPSKGAKTTGTASVANCDAIPPTTGLKGKVIWRAGNHMPGPPPKGKSPTPKTNNGLQQGIVRTVFVYPPIGKGSGLSEAKNQPGGFFNKPTNQKPIATLTTNQNGCFMVALPPGKYSLLVEEKGLLYANSFNGQGQVNVVQVVENKLTNIEIVIDYMAAY